uniref:Ubiquitin-conjugating enzyme E2 U n=1 Tax=Microcebus murinus TaxID=30608 RepID=A0A8B7GJ86_MICMU|nr:ubiquitin-conjugating enzyme E2 U isoform X2 [Microcebus murinus]
MHCRAYLLLERDFQEFKMNDFEGIIVVPVSEDLMKWEAEIRGLQNTISHELVFQLTMDFTTEYSYVPPVVKFKPIPFHPNVNPQTGRPCIDFLDNPSKWNERYTLSSILLALQVMLSNPVPENPVNFEAAQILMKDKSLYRTITLKLFKEPSQSKDDSQNLPEEPQKGTGPVKTISFNDYYKTWSEIATSKATEFDRTPLLEDPNFIGQYYKWRKMDLQYPKEWKLRFGALKSRFARKDGMPHRASHSTERGHLCPTPDDISSEPQTAISIITGAYETEEELESDTTSSDNNESWEEEVDSLVAWTSALNTETLED